MNPREQVTGHRLQGTGACPTQAKTGLERATRPARPALSGSDSWRQRPLSFTIAVGKALQVQRQRRTLKVECSTRVRRWDGVYTGRDRPGVEGAPWERLIRCLPDMKKLFAGIFVSIAVFTASAQQQKRQWRAYVYPDDGFGITLPAPTTPYDDGGDRHIRVYPVRLENGSIFILRVVHRVMDCDTALADLWDKAQSNSDQRERVVQGSLRQVSLNGLQGLEYETSAQAGERILHRFHCGNKLFYILSAGYKGERPADLERIINSFQVVNPAHQ